MSLENLQLSAYLIEELYRNNLITEDKGQADTTSPASKGIASLGKNQKNVLVIVKERDTVFLQDDDLALLLRIIHPCGLSMADISLINIENTPSDNTMLSAQFKPSKVILFGAGPSDIELPMLFPPFQVQHYNNCSYLCSPSLAGLSQDVEQKKKLWQSLQKLFSL